MIRILNSYVNKSILNISKRNLIIAAPTAKDERGTLFLRNKDSIIKVLEYQGKMVQSDWNCNSCDMYNSAHSSVCLLCNNGREVEKVQLLHNIVLDDAWRCFHCGVYCSTHETKCSECKTLRGKEKPPKKKNNDIEVKLPPKRTIIDELKELPDYNSEEETEFEFMEGKVSESESDGEDDRIIREYEEELARKASYREPVDKSLFTDGVWGMLTAVPQRHFCGFCGFETKDEVPCYQKEGECPRRQDAVANRILPCYLCGDRDHQLTGCPELEEHFEKLEEKRAEESDFYDTTNNLNFVGYGYGNEEESEEEDDNNRMTNTNFKPLVPNNMSTNSRRNRNDDYDDDNDDNQKVFKSKETLASKFDSDGSDFEV